MPMRTESSSDPSRTFTVARTGSASGSTSFPSGRSRSQTGFRSGTLTKEEANSITGRTFNRVSMLSHIALLEEEQRDIPSIAAQTPDQRVWPVNDRDYTETVYKPRGFQTQFRYSPYPYTSTLYSSVQGALGITQLLSGFMPGLPGDSTLEATAARLLRETRPPDIGFNLARFAAEQREAPLLFKAANYMPRSKKELGGAYLNFMFGLKPTGSDLGKLAELVLRSDGPVRTLLAHEKVREKKYGRKVILEDSNSGYYLVTSYANSSLGSEFWTGLHKTKIVYPTLSGTSGSYGNVLHPLLRWSYTRKQYVRSFATWEYFVPKPYEIEGRLALYRKNAKMLLSSATIDESTVYELTPWSWFANWFLDIGGLLRYQNAVNRNQLVMSSSGYSVWEEYTGFTHYAELLKHGNWGQYPYLNYQPTNFAGQQVTIRWRRHKRRGGNPYSIAPTWSLTKQQWAITSALGLSRGLDLPSKRS